MNAGLASLFLTANVDYISLTVHYTIPTLPVGITNFSITKQANAAKLNWAISSEQDNAYFEIYHSHNNKDFKTLATIAAKNTANNYAYLHKTPFNGANYYKLINVDNDGARSEVGLQALNFDLAAAGIFTSFNPSLQQLKVVFPQGTSQLDVFDITGRLLKRISIHPNRASEIISTDNLPPVYSLRVKGAWGSRAKKLVKL